MNDAYPYVKVGDQVTVTTTLPDPRRPGHPLTVNGPLTDYALDSEGRLLALAIREDPEREDPLVIPASSIIIWRAGAPVQVSTGPQSTIVVPMDGMPPGLG